LANTPLSSQFIAAVFCVAVSIAVGGGVLLRFGGQEVRDHVIALPTVDGAALHTGEWTSGAEVKLTAHIAPGHPVVPPGSDMVIAERFTTTPPSADKNSTRLEERDLEASFLPALRMVASDGTALRLEESSRVLVGSTTVNVPMESSSWHRGFRGLRNGDSVGLRGTIAASPQSGPSLTEVFMVAGTVDDLEGHYNAEVEESEQFGDWLFGISARVGAFGFFLVCIRAAWRLARKRWQTSSA